MNTERAILSIAMLAAFADGAKDDNLQAQYLPQIQDKARSLDATTIMSMVKGTGSPI